jgi:hypothetical protein
MKFAALLCVRVPDRPCAKIIRRTAKGARSWGREVARIPTATVAGPDSRMIASAVVGRLSSNDSRRWSLEGTLVLERGGTAKMSRVSEWTGPMTLRVLLLL